MELLRNFHNGNWNTYTCPLYVNTYRAQVNSCLVFGWCAASYSSINTSNKIIIIIIIVSWEIYAEYINLMRLIIFRLMQCTRYSSTAASNVQLTPLNYSFSKLRWRKALQTRWCLMEIKTLELDVYLPSHYNLYQKLWSGEICNLRYCYWMHLYEN